MTGKHTKGPWTGRIEIPIRAVDQERLGYSLIFVSTQKEELKAEARANAQLIAVLPELLAMVETLSAYDSYETEYDGRMYSICPACGNQDGQHSDRCDFVLARALIAKATGEAS